MQDSEENPPPGGKVVRAAVQPGTGWGGAGAVVGVAEGARLVLVEGAEEAGPGRGGGRCATAGLVDERAAHPPDTITMARTTAAVRLPTT
jgi:hypothetical protein